MSRDDAFRVLVTGSRSWDDDIETLTRREFETELAAREAAS